VLDHVWEGVRTEWVFAARDWVPGHDDDDLRWLLDRLEDAMAAWRPDMDLVGLEVASDE